MKDGLCCCVCLKDEPFENNPIVSCDGKNCTTVVHKTCYGIQQIPDGAWFCQKCISQERSARVRCELCPSREGALKHTNKGGWCHIVCALFVPGAEFLDLERLETVSLDKISVDKLNKVCSICEKNNRLDRASIGACIQCVKSGCKVMFHVTCGQSQGLLTEVVSLKEGVRYVAYCALHRQKIKRRDFTIRLSNSSSGPIRNDKNKSRQSPPQLEKSDEDCVTPQESSSSIVYRSSSSRNPNISSSSSNINMSSDSMSQDDSFAPQICTRSELKECREKTKSFMENINPIKCPSMKTLDRVHSNIYPEEKLQPPNITIEMLTNPNDNLLPPNICCSDASESIPKEEATVKFNMFSTSSTASNKSGGSEMSVIRTSKRQAALLTPNIPQKKEKIFKSEQKGKANINTIESPIKLEKIKKAKKISNAVKTKIENRIGKKSIAPGLPKSIFNHMSSIIGGTTSSTISNNAPSTSSMSSTPKIGGTSCQSMEELLEWQWDQAGALLMQQAEASDIASLLSCLHDLKNENELLLSKQLKLSHRRDHLKAVNSKLQLQLITKPAETSNKAVSSVPIIGMSDFRPICPQSTLRPLSKAPPAEQAVVQYKQLSGGSNEPSRGRPNPEGSSVFIQQALPVWTQSPSQHDQQRVDQSINHQTLALLKHYQQQQHQGIASPITQPLPTGVSISNLFSQTDLVTILNRQLQSQLTGCGAPSSNLANNQQKPITQDVHISPNNGTNMEFLYQALQQKYQPQTTPNIFYQATSKLTAQSGNIMNYDSPISQNPDRPQFTHNTQRNQITRPSDPSNQQR